MPYPRLFLPLVIAIALSILSVGCDQQQPAAAAEAPAAAPVAPEYFSLRPELEKMFGYTHAVRIGSTIKVSGAVSMDEEGNPTGVGDMAQQIKNCYADLEKVLTHYGCTFDDVVVEDIFTTDMSAFLQASGYRAEIYPQQFPTGTWLGVKELAHPDFMVEIELEVFKGE